MVTTKLVCFIAACWTLLVAQGAHIKPFNKSNKNPVIYECDFDSVQDADSDCSLIRLNLTGIMDTIESLKVSELNDYTITDVSSIKKPTSNGKECQLPFDLNGQQYYHCTADSECETESGLADCQVGKFFGGQANNRFTDAFETRGIELPVHNSYELSYYYFIYCKDGLCESGQDLVEVSITHTSPDGTQKPPIKFTHTDVMVGDKIQWQKQVQNIQLEPGKIDIQIMLRRPVRNTNRVYIGFDSITLTELPDGFTTPPPPTPIEDLSEYEIVYQCDFDYNTDCDVEIESTNHYKTQVVTKSTVLATVSTRNYQITDVSSITKPTINNNTCQIPYDFLNIKYYHCNTAFECELFGVFPIVREKCFDQGYFLNAKVANKDTPQSADITFPSINIDEDGHYVIEYFVLMYCDKLSDAECQEAAKDTDFIQVSWSNNENQPEMHEFSIKQKPWARQRHYTDLKQGNLSLSVKFDRVLGKNDLIVQYGFDELKIYKINSSSTTPAPTRPITTSASVVSSIIDYPCLSSSQNNCSVELTSYGANIEYKSFTAISDECIVSSYSSMIAPTKTNKKCQQSFVYNSTQYTTCVLIDSKLQCYTDDFTMDECTSVPFILARPRSDSNEYEVRISLRDKLTQVGKYKLSFHAIMYCCQCISTSGYIRVSSISNSHTDSLFNITSYDLIADNDWNSVQTDIDVTDLDFEIRIVLGKYAGDLKAENVGIDNIKLTFIPESKSQTDWTLVLMIAVPALVGFILTVAIFACICDVACKKLASNKQSKK